MVCKQHLDSSQLLRYRKPKRRNLLRRVLIGSQPTLGAGAKPRLHTPNAVTYHEQPQYSRCMISHSLVRMESRIKKLHLHPNYDTFCFRPKKQYIEDIAVQSRRSLHPSAPEQVRACLHHFPYYYAVVSHTNSVKSWKCC